MRKLERTLKALADPNRLRILNVLFQGELCVCDLQSVLELSQPLLSRHLAYLRNAGMVQDRRDGPRVFYSLALDGEVGKAVREFLQKVFPLYEAFQADSARMREFITCSNALEDPEANLNRPVDRQSKEEVSDGNQSSSLQL